MTKPTNPKLSIPENFAIHGVKTDFEDTKIQNGFNPLEPDILSGDNLNKFIDDTYKGLNYASKGVADLYKGVILYDETETYSEKSIVFNIDADGKISIYKSLIAGNTGNELTDETKWQKVSLGGSGLEIGDIGIAPLGIDESKGLRRYLNGSIMQINTNTQEFLNKLKSAAQLYPSLVCTETEWQQIVTSSDVGQCGKFVINETAATIRLPKIVMPIQGLINLASLGDIVESGLPNITGSTQVRADKAIVNSGCLYSDNAYTSGLGYSNGAGAIYNLYVDASRSNNIYGKSDTVQQEAVQYPYFIQIATGKETKADIVNTIQLNNPYSLFDCKYSDHQINNLSWVHSQGQWNSGAVYVDAYQLLLKVHNGTEIVDGLSVKLSTDADITDYDFVLNTADETFRLPLKTKLATGNAVVGNGMTLGLTDGNNNTGAIIIDSEGIMTRTGAYGTPVGSIANTGAGTNKNITIGITTEASKSGMVLSDADLYLYYYVGETVQNANLINAGRIPEQLTTKTDLPTATKASMPSDRYIDLTLGASGTTYIAPEDGYFTLNKHATGNNQYVLFIKILNSSLEEWIQKSSAINGADCSLTSPPVKKGDVLQIQYNAGGDTSYFRFIYAQGVKNE